MFEPFATDSQNAARNAMTSGATTNAKITTPRSGRTPAWYASFIGPGRKIAASVLRRSRSEPFVLPESAALLMVCSLPQPEAIAVRRRDLGEREHRAEDGAA